MNGLDKNLLNLILEHVNDKKQLIHCTLVCKRWTSMSRNQIIEQFYNSISFEDAYMPGWSFSYKQLTSIPVEIGRLKNIENLWLDANCLRHIPAEIGNITSLRMLIFE